MKKVAASKLWRLITEGKGEVMSGDLEHGGLIWFTTFKANGKSKTELVIVTATK